MNEVNDVDHLPTKHEQIGARTEHEQFAPESGDDWHYNYTDIHSGARDRYHIRQRGNGDCIAHTRTEYAAKTIIEHARLAALVPGLEAVLRELLDCETNLAGCSGIKLLDAVDAARAALNAVTKESQQC